MEEAYACHVAGQMTSGISELNNFCEEKISNQK